MTRQDSMEVSVCAQRAKRRFRSLRSWEATEGSSPRVHTQQSLDSEQKATSCSRAGFLLLEPALSLQEGLRSAPGLGLGLLRTTALLWAQPRLPKSFCCEASLRFPYLLPWDKGIPDKQVFQWTSHSRCLPGLPHFESMEPGKDKAFLDCCWHIAGSGNI